MGLTGTPSFQVHHAGRCGDGHVGALQPAAADIHEGCGAGLGAVADRCVEELGLVAIGKPP